MNLDLTRRLEGAVYKDIESSCGVLVKTLCAWDGMRFPDPNSLILDLFKRIGNASCLRKLHLTVPPGYRPVTHGFSQIEARLFAPFEDCYDMGPWSKWGVVEALRGLVQGTKSLEVTVTELYYVGVARPPCGRFFNRMRNVVGI